MEEKAPYGNGDFKVKSEDADRFKEIIDEMFEIYKKKNHDYGNSFSDSVKQFGLIAGFVPILHKCNRLGSLVKGNKPHVKESMRDTALDMANYCILYAMELENPAGYEREEL